MNQSLYKKQKYFSLLRNVIYQFVFFPLFYTAIAIVPVVLVAFVSIFIPRGSEPMTFYIVFSCITAMTASILSAIILYLIMRKHIVEGSSVYHKIILFAPQLFSLIIILFAYLVFGGDAAAIAAIVSNPVMIVINALFYSMIPSIVCVALFVAMATYSLTFFLLFSKKLKKENSPSKPGKIKLPGRLVAGGAALIIALSFVLSAAIVYPDAEYYVLSQKYWNMTFTEDDDYNLHDSAPFGEYSKLPTLNGDPDLIFEDIEKMPKLDGATAFYPVYAAFVQAIYKGLEPYADSDIFIYPETNVNNEEIKKAAAVVSCTKTGTAYDRLREGKVDMIFTFEPSAEQAAEAEADGVEYRLTTIGYEAFCFFVNDQNSVDSLTSKQVQDIYAGKISNWKAVGGANKRILAFTRPEGSGSQTIMKSAVMKGVPIDTRYEAYNVRTMGPMLKVVGGYLNSPAALGYTFMFYSSEMMKEQSIRYLKINGVYPTHETVRSGEYVLNVPFYAVTRKGEESAETIAFLEWITGAQGCELIEKTGYPAA